MKKGIYILIIVFLTYGKSFATSVDLLTGFEINTIEKLFDSYHNSTCQIKEKNKISFDNDFCKILPNRCSNFKLLMNQEHIACQHCNKLSNSLEKMKPLGISNIYYKPYINTTYQIKPKNKMSFDNDFFKFMSNESSNSEFLMYNEDIKCKHITKLPNSLEEMKYLNIANNYYPFVSNCETTNCLNHKKFDETQLTYSSAKKLNLERSQNINLEESIFQLTDSNYFRGFGIRIKI